MDQAGEASTIVIRTRLADTAQIGLFDALIDVRSPVEFAEDHLPGAINCPVLEDDERAAVGTLYREVSPFAARRKGAALVAHNIANHIETSFIHKDKEWRPLVYCWRGGQRSEAMTIVLNQIGWKATKLEGGYKSWRKMVLQALEALPGQLGFIVIAGPTGSGKSRLLDILAEQGAQVLHLERLAAHKGSVLGALPDTPQPHQKMFESRLYTALAAFNPQKPVFVEAESRRIGRIYLPSKLLEAFAQARCLRISTPLAARVDLLVEEYAWVNADPERLCERLLRLRDMHHGETMRRWLALAQSAQHRQLARELLEQHYDPLYQRSQLRQFSQFGKAPLFESATLDQPGLQSLACAILESL